MVERDVVRLVVLDADELVLLFHTRDSTAPKLGTCWELPGGSIEPGETAVSDAVRELFEETGILAGGDALGPPTWRRDATYQYRGQRRLQHKVVLSAQLCRRRPPINASRRDEDELEDCFESRWWPVPEIVESQERFYPGRLPGVLPAFLAGEKLEEAFEVWS